jgi:uncharacterized ion transporter superfamily protein YfcC
MGLLRLIVFGFIGLTVVYWLISVYSASVRREKLEKRWQEDHPEADDETARDTYIEDGMQKYRAGLRRRLILLVYIIPAALVVAVLVLTNWN